MKAKKIRRPKDEHICHEINSRNCPACQVERDDESYDKDQVIKELAEALELINITRPITDAQKLINKCATDILTKHKAAIEQAKKGRE